MPRRHDSDVAADRQYVQVAAPLSRVEDLAALTRFVEKDPHGHGLIRLDDRPQAVLTVQQQPVDVEGNPLMCQEPPVVPHVAGQSLDVGLT